MNYHQLPCGTLIPPEGLKAWVRDRNDEEWCEALIIAYSGNRDDYRIRTVLCSYCFYTLTDPNAKKKRWMTPSELWGKAIYVPSTDRWLAVTGISIQYIFLIGYEHGFSVEGLQNKGWKWADHPSGTVHDSFEVGE